MLIARKSMLQSELSALTSMVTFNNQNKQQSEDTVNNLQHKLDKSSEIKENKTNEAGTSLSECMSENAEQAPPSSNGGSTTGAVGTPPSSQPQSGSGPACQKYKQANQEVVTATFNEAQVKSELDSARFLLNSKGQFNSFLQTRVNNLEVELRSIDADLNESKPYLGEVADSREFRDLNSILNETEQSLDDGWLAFSYDSDSSHIDSDQETKSTTVSASFGVVGPGWGIQAAANYGKGTADLKQALNSANLKVSGELLRVVIKRPWFRPSLFLNPSLSFVSNKHCRSKHAFNHVYGLGEDD